MASFEIVSEITEIEVIAVGKSIRDLWTGFENNMATVAGGS